MLHICNYGLWRTTTFFNGKTCLMNEVVKEQFYSLTVTEFSNEHSNTLKVTTADSLYSK